MGRAPVGAMVRLYYDGTKVGPGDVLRTPTGRCYRVFEKRVQRRGARIGRQHLSCIVVKSAPPGSHVVPLHWYPRKAKRARRESTEAPNAR